MLLITFSLALLQELITESANGPWYFVGVLVTAVGILYVDQRGSSKKKIEVMETNFKLALEELKENFRATNELMQKNCEMNFNRVLEIHKDAMEQTGNVVNALRELTQTIKK